jgi:hypothetical protein
MDTTKREPGEAGRRREDGGERSPLGAGAESIEDQVSLCWSWGRHTGSSAVHHVMTDLTVSQSPVEDDLNAVGDNDRAPDHAWVGEDVYCGELLQLVEADKGHGPILLVMSTTLR